MRREADFLAQCVAGTTGNPVLEQIRDRSAEVVLALYRLLKTSLLHAIDNAATVDAAAQAATIMSGFAAEVGSAATVTFVDDSSFVCGQLLRASRSVYEAAAELGGLLAKAGVSECAVEAGATGDDLLALAREFARAARDPEARARLPEAKLSHVTVRKVNPRLVKREREDDLSPSERVLRLYAQALVVLRAFYEDVAAGKTILPHRVKRLAQRLVVAAESEDPAVLGMTAMAKSHRDDAGRALQTAILAIAVGRKLTTERVTLAQLAMAALLADVGRVRFVGRSERAHALSAAEEARVPATGAFACIVTGGINPTSAQRAVTVVEASWLERAEVLGPAWGGELPPMLASQLLLLVRAVLDRIAPRDGAHALSPTDALEAVAATAVDRTLLRLLVAAVGLVPTGSVVELDTGEWAVVVGPSPRGPHACVVRIVTDPKGVALESPRALDLGAASAARVVRVVEPEKARFNVTLAFVS